MERRSSLAENKIPTCTGLACSVGVGGVYLSVLPQAVFFLGSSQNALLRRHRLIARYNFGFS
jgi:acetyl-CoA carboxylase carboxyltransferase component